MPNPISSDVLTYALAIALTHVSEAAGVDPYDVLKDLSDEPPFTGEAS